MKSATMACIVGWGARTVVGLRAPPSAAAVRAGISRIVEHPYMVDKAGEPYRVALDRELDSHERLPRIRALLECVMGEVLEAAPLSPASKVFIFLALPERSRHFSQEHEDVLVAHVAMGLAGRCRPVIKSLALGDAAGAVAVQLAVEACASSGALCVVVGADSDIDADLLEELDCSGRLMSSENRWGFPPGEGAGALLIASPSTARSLKFSVLATIDGVGSAREPHPDGSDGICVGQGLTEAFRGALSRLDVRTEPIDMGYCDFNGERFREREYAYALLRMQPGMLRGPSRFVAPSDCWGHVGSATVPLLTGLVIASGMRQYARGPRALVWASSRGPTRGAVVVSLPPR
ncbi:hypothetical protein [Myxococcus sp. CA040A]|uniref:hypothetical protein n=1 Tax=Myxococcus sp. CA040A TaxID=2741738 RepID=UPI00157ABE56|nr:hypothetical protein [Myxococcus sp. CA040A]NTX05823.1 hypothetical protein [Myxococcus sp. CA040A]